mgnify:CR=1 FL=1
MNILNNKNKRTSIFKALALCLFAAVSLTLASCDDDMDIQQSYPFTVETMPVPNKVTKGQTVEIRCELKKTGEFANTLYTIRYFQFEGEGTLKMDNGITFLPNDRYLLENEKPEAQKFAAAHAASLRNVAAESEIDLRGMDTMEAVAATERFLDNAVMAKLEKVTIIHGKGTGALRKAVHASLRRNKAVKGFRLGNYGEGESGVTVVELK